MHLFINVCNIEEIGTITCLPAFNRNCVSNIYRTSLSRKSFRFNARASAHQRTLCEIHYIHWSMNKVSQLVRLVLIECSLGGIEAKKKIRKKYMKRRYPRVHEDWWNLRSWGMLRLHNEISIQKYNRLQKSLYILRKFNRKLCYHKHNNNSFMWNNMNL